VLGASTDAFPNPADVLPPAIEPRGPPRLVEALEATCPTTGRRNGYLRKAPPAAHRTSSSPDPYSGSP
jgi:hypothetical protein